MLNVVEGNLLFRAVCILPVRSKHLSATHREQSYDV